MNPKVIREDDEITSLFKTKSGKKIKFKVKKLNIKIVRKLKDKRGSE